MHQRQNTFAKDVEVAQFAYQGDIHIGVEMAKIHHIHHAPQPKCALHSHLCVLVADGVHYQCHYRGVEHDAKQAAEYVDALFELSVAQQYVVVVHIEQEQTVEHKAEK